MAAGKQSEGFCRVRKIKVAFATLLCVLSLLWLMADSLLPEPLGYFSFRVVFIQYSGVISIGLMSVAMLLAVRPGWLERPLGGLDKAYRLHKWLGITGLVSGTLHWWWAQGTKWMVGWGWLVRPERKASAAQALSGFEQWLRGQRGLAESLGEWAFYAAAVLIVLALLKAVPYAWFKRLHKGLPVVYLVLVYHSLILIKADYWLQPVGWAMGLLMLVGSVSALLALTGQIGRSRRVAGVIKRLTAYPALQVIEGTLQLEQGWPGHRPGQFAFVTSDHCEGAHPYSIASAWNPREQCLTFVIKAVGDWTARLGDWLKVGMPVSVEGPYGCFDFQDAQPRQIWVGAGIGITPFIARMKALAQSPGQQAIDLFHITREYDQAALDQLAADAKAANVRLHLTVTPKDGRLMPEQIRAAVPGWRDASLWFCGPAAFGDALCHDFVAQGLPARQYHQELFSMR